VRYTRRRLPAGRPAVVSAASTNPRQLIYVDDCVDAIIAVLAAEIDARVKYLIDTAEHFSDGRIGPLSIDAAQRDFGFVAHVDIVE
jgi:nucleoside-diphosphate-sugar epimerase